MNKERQKVNKYVEPWAKNAFYESKFFYGFSMKKSIIDLFEDEGLVKQIVDMSYFVLQVVKKDVAYILQLGNFFFKKNLNFLLFFSFCKKGLVFKVLLLFF